MYQVKFLNVYLSQLLLDPFLNNLAHLNSNMWLFETHVFHHYQHHLNFVRHLQKQLHAVPPKFRTAVSDKEVCLKVYFEIKDYLNLSI